jgi:hypothetical protein
VLKTYSIRLLRLLRSRQFRDVYVSVAARLCSASLAGSAWLYYAEGTHAIDAIRSLSLVGFILFGSALAVALGDQ